MHFPSLLEEEHRGHENAFREAVRITKRSPRELRLAGAMIYEQRVRHTFSLLRRVRARPEMNGKRCTTTGND